VQWAALTVSVFAVTALQYWLLADAIGGRIGVHEAWLALGLSQLAAIVSLIPLGIGSADSSLAALLDRFGMTLAQGAAVALLVRALSVVPLVVVAFACYLWLVRRAPASPERAPAPPRPEHAA
jgi:uncharacterized membrane protein YbhN (UPF0104 family)